MGTDVVPRQNGGQLKLKDYLTAPAVVKKITEVAAANLDIDRLVRIALVACSKSSKLLLCTPPSVHIALMEAARLGLEPTGLLGGAYLVPFKNKRGIYEAKLMIGYPGLIDLACRSGKIEDVEARVVYEKDEFYYCYGLQPDLVHRPSKDADPGPVAYTYAIAWFSSGRKKFEVMSRAQIEHVRMSGASGDSDAWKYHPEEMARKCPVRRLCKYLPLTAEAREAIDQETQNIIEIREATVQAPPPAGSTLKSRLQARRDNGPPVLDVPDDPTEPPSAIRVDDVDLPPPDDTPADEAPQNGSDAPAADGPPSEVYMRWTARCAGTKADRGELVTMAGAVDPKIKVDRRKDDLGVTSEADMERILDALDFEVKDPDEMPA